MINQNILEVTQERSQDGSDVEAVDDQSQDSLPPETQQTPAALNMMHSYLQGLSVMASPVTRTPKSSNNELINISSDEGDDDPPPPKRSAPANMVQRAPHRGRSQQPHNAHHHQHPRQEYVRGDPQTHSTRVGNHIPEWEVPKGDHHNQNSKEEDLKRKKPKTRLPNLSIFPTNKKKVPALPDTVPETKMRDFGGYPKVLQDVSDLLLHFYQSSIYSILGVTPPRGFLLHGPPGCGKTLLAHAVAGELNLPLVKVSGPELIGGISGESEERIRKIFMQAKQQVPCILFIDEIDVISQTRESARKDMEKRVVSQLIVSLDDLNTCDEGDDLIVIGATNRVEELDPGLRRAGRFDKEVCIGIPDRTARVGILNVLCRFLKLSPGVSIEKIAELTPGFVAADLKSLISDAAVAAIKRIFQQRQTSSKSKPTIVNDIPIKIVDDDKSEGSDDSEKREKLLDENSHGSEKKADKSDGAGEAERESKEKRDSEKVADTDKAKEGEKTSETADGPSEAEKPMDIEKPVEAVDKPDEDEESAKPPSETAEKPVETAEEPEKSNAMDVDDVSNDVGSPLEAGPVGCEVVVENGVANDDQRSDRSEDVCVIVEENTSKKGAEGSSPPQRRPKTSEPQPIRSMVVQIEMEDLLTALKTTQPSAKREGFATVPDVTWDDIGSLKDVRKELTMSIMMPVKYPEEFKRMGIDAPSGIMLWGPPGCGKTLLAKAIANEANINFISVKGPELLNMYVGESEKAVRTCFARARNSKPCVIFFDEMDALCPRRSDSSEGSVSSRVVNQVLTEMDGVEGREGVFLMAASNRPDMIDPAVLRPGRLDKIVKVGLPNALDRVDILRAITKNGTKPPLETGVCLEKIGTSESCEGYSGADLSALVKEASVLALDEYLVRKEDTSAQHKPTLAELLVGERHFQSALKKIKPSVHAEERLRYELLDKLYSAS